jgi:hypothetical protein
LYAQHVIAVQFQDFISVFDYNLSTNFKGTDLKLESLGIPFMVFHGTGTNKCSEPTADFFSVEKFPQWVSYNTRAAGVNAFHNSDTADNSYFDLEVLPVIIKKYAIWPGGITPAPPTTQSALDTFGVNKMQVFVPP